MTKLKLFPSAPSTPNSPSSLLEALNPEQRKAAETIDGPVLILAGAGSGKTRALTYRIAHMLEMGIQPWNILALTFTNKAAREMQERIAKLTDAERAQAIWAGTFHSIFARILRIECVHIGYDSAFSIHDSDDTLRVVKNIMQSLHISHQEFSPQMIRGSISKAKNDCVSWQQYDREKTGPYEHQVALVYAEYEKRMRRSNAMDFDDLLVNIIRLFDNNPAVLEKYRKRFTHISVDEYQDTNQAQYRAVKLLSEPANNICVVGDDAQSIYRWRGADIRNILDFERDYPNAQIIRLEQNYRSTGTILKAANDIIKNNERQVAKKLWTENDKGDDIALVHCSDERHEARSTASSISDCHMKEFATYNDFAVLYRTNAQSQPVEEALRMAGIPYRIIGGVSFFRRKEVKDFVAWLKLLVNPHDDEYVSRAVSEPPSGIGRKAMDTATAIASENDIPLMDVFREARKYPELSRFANNLMSFADKVFAFAGKSTTMSLPELAEMVLVESGLEKRLKDTDEEGDRFRNAEQVIAHMSEVSAENEELTLTQYLEQVALVEEDGQNSSNRDAVTLMTLHAAKGLEFPYVYILGMEQGLFPLGKSDQNPDELEEERRLFYVGITRAEKALRISTCARRFRFGETMPSTPSQFLQELGDEYVVEVGQSAARRRDASSSLYSGNQHSAPVRKKYPASRGGTPVKKKLSFAELTAQSDKAKGGVKHPSGIAKGVKVEHSTFGIGIVQAVNGSGDNTVALVNFNSGQLKKLVLKFAKLKVLK